MNHTIPSRRLREHPNLGQLKRQAKELLRAFAAGKPAAEEKSALTIAGYCEVRAA